MSNINLIKRSMDFFGKRDKYALDQEVLDRISIINPSNEKESENRSSGTKAIFTMNGSGCIYGFMIYGYTGYAKKGYDIVSSAISALSLHTINTIRKYTNDINEDKSNDGILMFMLPNLRDGLGSDTARILLSSMVESMIEIQEQYSDYLKIYIKKDY